MFVVAALVDAGENDIIDAAKNDVVDGPKNDTVISCETWSKNNA